LLFKYFIDNLIAKHITEKMYIFKLPLCINTKKNKSYYFRTGG